ncbi:toll/interleukin-1 receptor domain-containing protein [soil metagenome]
MAVDPHTDTPAEHPRVFLSHASQDKDRFVREFAGRLRDRGVDVWFDEWELLPGDSLVDKIFEEGLQGAEVFLIVISQHSIESGWVREELDGAVVRKIEKQCRIIPIVIESCAIPEVLKHTVWQRIDDINSYDPELDRIVRAIYDVRQKPPLGNPPGYAGISPAAGLQAIDTRVLQVAGEMALKTDSKLLDSHSALAELASESVSEDAFLESLEVLEGRGYLKIVKTLAQGIDGMSAFMLTTWGLHEYCQAFLPDYDRVIHAVSAFLVNHGGGADGEIGQDLGKPRQLVENVLDLFEANGWIRATKLTGPTMHVHWVSPELKRELENP